MATLKTIIEKKKTELETAQLRKRAVSKLLDKYHKEMNDLDRKISSLPHAIDALEAEL